MKEVADIFIGRLYASAQSINDDNTYNTQHNTMVYILLLVLSACLVIVRHTCLPTSESRVALVEGLHSFFRKERRSVSASSVQLAGTAALSGAQAPTEWDRALIFFQSPSLPRPTHIPQWSVCIPYAADRSRCGVPRRVAGPIGRTSARSAPPAVRRSGDERCGCCATLGGPAPGTTASS